MPDFANDDVNGAAFESSVRHVARQLYRHAHSSGSIKLDGRERDEVIDTGTELIVVEATTLRKLDKVEQDLKKSIDLVKALRQTPRFSEYNFRILLVTADDPTADQNAHVRNARAGCPKEIISYTALFSRLFDARHYIRLRADHSFGSVRNPADESDYQVPPSNYIPTALNEENKGVSLKAPQLATQLMSGGRHVIYGDYGSGKSMTLRDIYFRVRNSFIAGQVLSCPVYLNLREHIAQSQPDEALYRHAEKIGFPEPHSLIAAWRAGFVTLFLDGFDELTPPQFASSVSNLRQARRFAVEIVRRFIEQTPKAAAILVAGRESYFDSRAEALDALGVGMAGHVYDLAGFTDADIQKYLNTKGGNLPRWLPTRPLLLGYLANSGLLRSGDELASLDPARGWDDLLRRVCQREVSQIWGVGFEAADLRLFIDGLATRARHSRDGRGLEDSSLRQVFRFVFGRDTDEPANLLTCRLPGLGSVPGKSGAREFIDADFADASASGDLSRYIEAPFVENSPLRGIATPLGSLGREMAVISLPDAKGKLSVALAQSSKDVDLTTTVTDLISALLDLQQDYVGDSITLKGANLDLVVVDPEIDLSRITFEQCVISTVELTRTTAGAEGRKSPKFLDCVIDRMEGALTREDVPVGIFKGSTSVEVFTAFTATNDAVMRTALPDPVKVLLTVLRKLFMQRGTGRQYSALRRGMPVKLVKYVDPVVAEVKAHGYAEDIYLDRRTILIPNRTRSADALGMINGPNTCTDPLITSVRRL